MHAVLDALLFCLLVGAAVGTLSLPADRLDAGSADAAATTLTTTTASVNYTLAPGARQADESLVAFPTERGPEFRRTDHGTLAALLASAAVGNVTVVEPPDTSPTELTHASDDHERVVRRAVRNATRGGRRVAVRAVWEPYPGAPVSGRVHVGPRPPPTADVWAVSRAVDSELPSVRERAIATATDHGYDGVARVVADAVVRGLFPPRSTRHALHGDHPVDALVAYRYRRFAELLDARVAGPVSDGESRRANARLRRALADRLADDLRTSFDSPPAAARAVTVGEVRLTVRTWSP
jgi:hypothetical protein